MTKTNYKGYSFNVIPLILAEGIINYLTIKASIDPIIIDPVILNIFTEGGYEPLYVCDKSVITFGTRKKIFYNTAHVDSIVIHPIETKNNSITVIKDKLLVSNIMKHFPIHKYVHNY